ncbi:NADP-dependent oxidoreductase [Actinoplanes rectilineatus]|uniref:NADP-dependent oxidoreductase n=1 Tax=Actinoplanes rectilineatus TaxID=113571 RepID=UPI0005F28363|nr:NADP-dependent oxidoreductase [Actinoplanes rectilineatus]
MRAVIATSYGSPFTVADIPTPVPGPGQLQVRIAAAALNPADLRIAAGDLRAVAELTFPHTLGTDFAGTVTAVAPDVTAYTPGDEIFGHAMPRALRPIAGRHRPSLGSGTLAEFAVVEADTPFITHRPPGLDPADAAALGTAGLVARALLIRAAIQPGETVLVIGATGGIGTALIPLLADTKARVIATTTPPDADILRGLGASRLIPYGAEHYPGGTDVVLNLVLPGDRLDGAAAALRPGGRLYSVTFPAPRPDLIGRDDVTAELVLDSEGALGGMREVAELAGTGLLRPTVGGRYELDEGPRAYADLATRHTLGKQIVIP